MQPFHDEEDLRIDIYDLLADDPQRYHVRVRHEPTATGAVATGPHLIETRERAIARLRQNLGDAEVPAGFLPAEGG